MPDSTPATALIKTAQSPALARVSNQLALTNKLLAKSEEPCLILYRKGTSGDFVGYTLLEKYWRHLLHSPFSSVGSFLLYFFVFEVVTYNRLDDFFNTSNKVRVFINLFSIN